MLIGNFIRLGLDSSQCGFCLPELMSFFIVLLPFKYFFKASHFISQITFRSIFEDCDMLLFNNAACTLGIDSFTMSAFSKNTNLIFHVQTGFIRPWQRVQTSLYYIRYGRVLILKIFVNIASSFDIVLQYIYFYRIRDLE